MKDLISELIERLKNADKELTEAISSGVNIHSFDAYQRLVGKREGVLTSLNIINQILSEDDEDLR
jgi:hypothetical protein